MDKIRRFFRFLVLLVFTLIVSVLPDSDNKVYDVALVEIDDAAVPLSSGESVVLVLRKSEGNKDEGSPSSVEISETETPGTETDITSETDQETDITNETDQEAEEFSFDNINGSSIKIPAGTYDLNNEIVYLDKYVSISGAGSDKTILKNLCIIAPYGISIEGLTMDGGVTTSLRSEVGARIDRKALVVIPYVNDGIKISYKNAIFCNADYVSSIYGTGSIVSDSAEGCTFYNISRVAILHSINSENSTYKNNTFYNIGDSAVKNEAVSALWIGDVTNNTNTQSADLTISGNKFNDLITADDPDFTKHAINANFIAVRAAKAVIDDNKISGTHGFGDDREALYTKVNKLTITNNTIRNGGYGEGYITCKGQGKHDDYAIISGNKLYGDFGSGIFLYGPGEVSDNTIQIDNCPAAISCFQEENSNYSNTLTVSGNTIKCNPGYYYLNGSIAGTYAIKTAIDVYPSGCDAYIENNTIISDNPNGLWQYAIDAPCTVKNVTIRKNTINIGGKNSVGIFVHASGKYASSNSKAAIDVSANTINSGSFGINITMLNSSAASTKREYKVSQNIINMSTVMSKAVYVSGGDGNNDSLEYHINKNSAVKVWTNAAKISGDTSYVIR
ncbi:right-handed parallel beta-helix repeat-containing protein [Butyrivibrio sp. WCD3002]|uniref:right-handed parallel beta-helix repeat-containing protein n=1 Tax=Butyrivibrio sp. WCD3002 TaxID=1280676 RepID=UPI00040C76B8|nr:right-handed parallel beta-helix repeat-containing protein [Butyrivibrio sp. WCD3002]